jgi:anti-anti-sigma factor
MTEATVTVDPLCDDAVHVTVSGEIDLANTATVERQLLEAIPNHVSAVTVDLAGVDYLDSAGVRLLFTLGTRAETLQIDLTLVVPDDSPVRRILEIAGVPQAMTVRSTP